MADSHTYTDEYRRECADLVIASGRPATQRADEIGVNRKTLQHWVQRRKMELEGAMPTADPELKAAQKRIRELEMENAFLKKPRPSSPKTRRESEVAPDGGGEGGLPRQDNGPAARREPLGLLRMAAPGWAESFGPIYRVGIECSGSYGSGLMRHLLESGIEVLEVTYPDKSVRHKRGKDDFIDAEMAAEAAFTGNRTVCR